MSQDAAATANLQLSEVYWSLVAKADKKFSKIRDLPYYEHHRYDTHFHKVFKVYTKLWKFQQENRQKLVESGLKRWEIGDIASRIGQLYFGQYMRTSQASYLSEAYIFYEAVLTREYFKEGLFQDLNLANKQLRFLARFLTVCLVLNRRQMVYQLVNQLKMLVSEIKRAFQDTDFKEWKRVIRDITKFLKVDTAFMNMRPLRYSIMLDHDPDTLPHVSFIKRKLRLRDAILCSYHPNEVKFSELTIDNFRMLQCLEWEPSGSFYQSNGNGISTPWSNIGQSGPHQGSIRVNYYSQEISDPTLPPNPRKAVLYSPSTTHFIAVLATMCEELPADGVLLIYLSASGASNYGADNIQTNMTQSDAVCDNSLGGLNIGSHGNGDNQPPPPFMLQGRSETAIHHLHRRENHPQPPPLLISTTTEFPLLVHSCLHLIQTEAKRQKAVKAAPCHTPPQIAVIRYCCHRHPAATAVCCCRRCW